jgi:hypothetical protein
MRNSPKKSKPVYIAPKAVSLSGVAQGACSPLGSQFDPQNCHNGGNAGINCLPGSIAGKNCNTGSGR